MPHPDCINTRSHPLCPLGKMRGHDPLIDLLGDAGDERLGGRVRGAM